METSLSQFSDAELRGLVRELRAKELRMRSYLHPLLIMEWLGLHDELKDAHLLGLSSSVRICSTIQTRYIDFFLPCSALDIPLGN